MSARRSGRTTRMLMEAIDFARHNPDIRCSVIGANSQHASFMEKNQAPALYGPHGRPGNLSFASAGTLKAENRFGRQQDTEVTFWDHFALESAYPQRPASTVKSGAAS